MAQDIRVPEVSEGVEEGKVVSLAVAEGDRVEQDQTLLEMETDKAVVAIPAPFDGKITEILVGEGDTVKVGDVIMKGDAGGGGKKDEKKDEKDDGKQSDADDEKDRKEEEEKEKEKDRKEEKKEQDEKKEKEPEEKEEKKEKEEKEEKEKEESGKEEEEEEREAPREEKPEGRGRRDGDDRLPPSPLGAPPRPPEDAAVDLQTVRSGDRVAPAAPSIRRLARELGVDIYQVQGTGPGERISEDDVRAFVRTAMQRITGGGAAPAATGEFPGLHAQRPLPDFSKWGAVTVEPLSRVREITADSMSYAWSTIPMVTQNDEADVTDVETFRQDFNRKAADEDKLTMTAILLKVCAAALRAFPQVNSSLDLAHKELILKEYVHIGVAVDTKGGLLVPVVRDCDTKGLAELATELNETAAKTRDRKISPADMEGGTFTISNLGGIGGTSFSPIVYAPQVAILGVSRAATRPVWNGDGFVPRQVMPLSLTYDHRVVDGADGARFLRWICRALEQPLNLVMKG